MQRMTLLALAIVLTAGTAQAQEKFQRKSGLWEVKRTGKEAEDQARIFQMCVDQASDNAFRQLGSVMRSERCETSKVVHNGDILTVDAVCQVDRGRTKATTHAVVTGKLDSAYRVESNWTFDPPRHGEAQGAAVLEAKWTGACKPDQRPGDVILPSGLKINLSDQKKASAASRGAALPLKKGNYEPSPIPPTK